MSTIHFNPSYSAIFNIQQTEGETNSQDNKVREVFKKALIGLLKGIVVGVLAGAAIFAILALKASIITFAVSIICVATQTPFAITPMLALALKVLIFLGTTGAVAGGIVGTVLEIQNKDIWEGFFN